MPCDQAAGFSEPAGAFPRDGAPCQQSKDRPGPSEPHHLSSYRNGSTTMPSTTPGTAGAANLTHEARV